MLPARLGVTHRIRTRRFISAPSAADCRVMESWNGGALFQFHNHKLKTMTQFLPFSRFHQLADLALHQVSFEAADVVDVKLAIQVIGFVKEGARQ